MIKLDDQYGGPHFFSRSLNIHNKLARAHKPDKTERMAFVASINSYLWGCPTLPDNAPHQGMRLSTYSTQ
jgi:hypothetical protein